MKTFTLKNGPMAGVKVVAKDENNPKQYVSKTMATKAADKLIAEGHNVTVMQSPLSRVFYIAL